MPFEKTLPGGHKFLPKHDKADRSLINHNGAIIPNIAVFVRSGSAGPIGGSLTGSATITFDTSALRLMRVEVFHSGVASAFNLRIENSTPNTGSFFDPRDIVTCYNNIPGSVDFTGGIDQIEGDMVALTDCTAGREGNLYIRFMPYGSGDNYFKYLLFFEAVILYNNRAGESFK